MKHGRHFFFWTLHSCVSRGAAVSVSDSRSEMPGSSFHRSFSKSFKVFTKYYTMPNYKARRPFKIFAKIQAVTLAQSVERREKNPCVRNCKGSNPGSSRLATHMKEFFHCVPLILIIVLVRNDMIVVFRIPNQSSIFSSHRIKENMQKVF